MGQICYQKKKMALAERHFDKYIKIGKNEKFIFHSYFVLGSILYLQKRYKKSFKFVVKCKNNFPEKLILIYKLYKKFDKEETAQKILEYIKKNYKETSSAKQFLLSLPPELRQ